MNPAPKPPDNDPWFSAFAFLWLPVVCATAFLAAVGPSSADDTIMFLSFLAIPAGCGVATARVMKSQMPRRRLWITLNVIVGALTLTAGATFVVIVFLALRSLGS